MPELVRKRRLIAGLVLVLAVVIAAVTATVLLLGGEEPPATGAAAVVPGDALVYVHLSTDRSRPAVHRALALARRFPDFPLLNDAVSRRLAALLDGAPGAVAPWLGREAAFALLNTSGSSAGSLVVLDVSRPRLARRSLARSGASPDGSYSGTHLLRLPGGTELAFVRHYLVLGQLDSVRASIDASGGREPSLEANPVYRAAAATEPDGRVLDAYAPVGGVRRVLGPRSGLLGSLGVLLDQPALSAAAMSISAVDGGARVDVHESLDPSLAQLSGPAGTFSPKLPDLVPAQGALLLDVSGLSQWAPRVLHALAVAGVAGRVGPLLHRLGTALRSEGVDVGALTGIFSGESGLFISPPPAGQAVAGRGRRRSPALMIVTRTGDPQGTGSLLAGVEGPLAQLFPPPSQGPGQAPEFSDVPVSGVTVHRLALAPGLQLDYAVFAGLVALSTSLPGIGDLAAHRQPLSQEAPYQAALGDRPDEVTSLLFLDFRALLRLGEQTGLLGQGRLAAWLGDLERVSSVGLTTTRQGSDTNAELFLHIS